MAPTVFWNPLNMPGRGKADRIAKGVKEASAKENLAKYDAIEIRFLISSQSISLTPNTIQWHQRLCGTL